MVCLNKKYYIDHEDDALGNVKKPKLSPHILDEFNEAKDDLEAAVKKVSMEVNTKNSGTMGINVDTFMKPIKDTKDGLEVIFIQLFLNS